MSNIKPPDESLNSYFDDLLNDEMEQKESDALMAAAPNVIQLPKKILPTLVSNNVAHINASSASNTRPHLFPQSAADTQVSPLSSAQSLEQKHKLEKLLETGRAQLLISVVPPEENEPAPQIKTRVQSDPDEIQEWEIDTPSVEFTAEPEALAIVEAPPATRPYQIEGLEWLENGRPTWAQGRFDVLLFQVSGLTLAVPMISLGQIQPITKELTPLFGQADWFMGFQLTSTGKISTVNTAKFVMPERYDERFIETAKYVVSINGLPWGLAVDSVNQPITLEPDDVKWRTNRSKRPWLAGTVKDHMCVLLDIPRIGQLLIDADRNFVPRDK